MPKPHGEPLILDLRLWMLTAPRAIRDVYDALVELITNSDDRYTLLQRKRGRIEIEVQRRRKGTPSIVRVRDFADGMTLDDMRNKLLHVGRRESGMAEGHAVRGAYSRGAKDVAILGSVTFESVAADRSCHKCEITGQGRFIPYDSVPKSECLWFQQLKIPEGTGTVVTLFLGADRARVPQHERLLQDLRQLVVLRDILSDPAREVVLSDMNQRRRNRVSAPALQGKERLSKRFQIPGYEGVDAKLVVYRAKKPLRDDRGSRFRLGGLLVKSKRAIHESTFLAPELENDPHAKWFYGRLSCEHIDVLLNDFDDRFQQDLPPTADNPCAPVDPGRKQGLDRDHPFVRTLFAEALKLFRPLVEKQRREAEGHQAKIESQQTRKRLRALERAATKFMSQNREDEETTRDPDKPIQDSLLHKRGYALSPPFAQVVVGQSIRFWLQIRHLAFPELAVGDSVEISCATDDVTADKRFDSLEVHPNREGILRSIWKVKAEKATPATGVKVRAGPIVDECVIEVFRDERARFAHIDRLCFGKRRYTVQVNSKRGVVLYAPFPEVAASETPVSLQCSRGEFKIRGARILSPDPDLGIARCKLSVTCPKPDVRAKLVARIPEHECECELASVEAPGGPIKIELKDEAFGNQRYIWKPGGLLHIGTRHPSIRRYLGPPPDFPGQEQQHFRLLLAEIVAEAVCARVIARNAEEKPGEYGDFDWEEYYSVYCQLMTNFLPIAHDTQLNV